MSQSDFDPKSPNIPPKISSGIEVRIGDYMFVEAVAAGVCNGWNLRTKQKGVFPFEILDLGDLRNQILGVRPIPQQQSQQPQAQPQAQ